MAHWTLRDVHRQTAKMQVIRIDTTEPHLGPQNSWNFRVDVDRS